MADGPCTEASVSLQDRAPGNAGVDHRGHVRQLRDGRPGPGDRGDGPEVGRLAVHRRHLALRLPVQRRLGRRGHHVSGPLFPSPALNPKP